MPGKTENPTSADLGALLETLASSGIEFILVGGLAAVIQGAPVTTLDVDIVHKRSPENVHRLFLLLKSINARYRRPDDQVIEPREEDLTGTGHALFTTRSGALDVLSVIEEGNAFEELLEYTVEIEFRGFSIRVLSLEKMIELKRKSRDPKDKQRIAILEETLRQLIE